MAHRPRPRAIRAAALTLAVASISVLSACAPVPEAVRGTWTLSAGRDDHGAFDPTTGQATARLVIDGGRLEGTSICTSVAARIESVDPWHLVDVVSTEQACLDSAANDLTARYLSALVDAEHARVENAQLVLIGERSRLVFSPA